jgi:hypothetical protein
MQKIGNIRKIAIPGTTGFGHKLRFLKTKPSSLPIRDKPCGLA